MLLFITVPGYFESHSQRVSIHLMLLFIKTHLKISIYVLSCFNTSHVTLYLRAYHGVFPRISVSIHLMLLFIMRLRTPFAIDIRVSIHLMLLFIYSCLVTYLLSMFVSIHLMLLFIV